jgi:hypothetical protein
MSDIAYLSITAALVIALLVVAGSRQVTKIRRHYKMLLKMQRGEHSEQRFKLMEAKEGEVRSGIRMWDVILPLLDAPHYTDGVDRLTIARLRWMDECQGRLATMRFVANLASTFNERFALSGVGNPTIDKKTIYAWLQVAVEERDYMFPEASALMGEALSG